MKFGTKVIHAGIEPDPTTGAIMTPIFQTSTYVQEGNGVHKGYEYARTQNPTRDALQANIAALEGGTHGLAFSSGMAATDTIIKLLEPGDEVVAVNDMYGGTYRIFSQLYARYGIKFTFISMENASVISEHLTEKTKLVWVESPTNPMMNIIDIQAVADQLGDGTLLCVDNTFATPYFQNPLALGADIVMHSATKYLGGHSDVVMGLVVTSRDEVAERLSFIQNSAGAVPGPQDCFLMLRGIKTLHVRMDRHASNGEAIARYLEGHEKVEKVFWPGLESHPNHEVAKKQMRGFCGMVSFTLNGDNMDDANTVLNSVELFSLAESLGGVESLIGHPAGMTHVSIPKEEREKVGLKDTLIRLSVGIEDVDDLIADLDQALAKV